MWRYLSSAFWIRAPIPGLGDVPWNALACLGGVVLGFLNPGFWFLATAAEAALLTALVSSQRFRRAIDATHLEAVPVPAAVPLDEADRRIYARLHALWSSAERLIAHKGEQAGGAKQRILRQLILGALRLLTLRGTLQQHDRSAEAADVARRISGINAELARDDLPPEARTHRQETLEILAKRQALMGARQRKLDIIAVHLDRIEAQLQLVIEQDGLIDDDSFADPLLEAKYILDDPLLDLGRDEPVPAPERRERSAADQPA